MSWLAVTSEAKAAGAANALGLTSSPSSSSKYASDPTQPPLGGGPAPTSNVTSVAGVKDPATWVPGSNEQWVSFAGNTAAGHGPGQITAIYADRPWFGADTGKVFIETDGSQWWLRIEKPFTMKFLAVRQAVGQITPGYDAPAPAPAPSPAVEEVTAQAEDLAGDVGGDVLATYQEPAAPESSGLGSVFWIGGGALLLWLFFRMRRGR